jgi:hypothetical protein
MVPKMAAMKAMKRADTKVALMAVRLAGRRVS